MGYTLRGARLIDASTDLAAGEVTVEGERIAGARKSTDVSGRLVDVKGMTLVPGFVDVHTHGGGGHNLHTTDPGEILEYARWVASTGVTSFLIGVVGAPDGPPERELRAAAAAIEQWRGDQQGAQPLGIHLEGPYISERRRGAHQVAWLRLPNADETVRVLGVAGGWLRLVTLAPELEGAAEMIRRLRAAGVTVSMGHTDVSYEQALDAIGLGVRHVTHCFNAMRPLLHRDPGPLVAAAQATEVYGEVVADGHHVHPAMVEMLVRMLGAGRTVVITDALAAAGTGDVAFEFAGQQALVEHGVARLADGTIAGSLLTMDRALRNMVRWIPATLPATVGMLTRNPARSIGVDRRKGLLRAGHDADLVLLDADMTVQATICRGRLAYATDTWRERLAAQSGV